MFNKLLGKNKAKQDTIDIPPLSPALRSSILATVGAHSIPSLPSAAQKAFELSTDPNAEARDFIDVIEADEALSARVLKIANSVYFDRGKKSETIEESVLVIGVAELRGLLNATTLTELFPSTHEARTQFWANDIATALIARTLARRLLPQKVDTAFLGGLMHDIGKLLLLQRVSSSYEQVLEQVRTKGVPFCQAEEQVFVFNHTEVGQLIAEKWNFSNELIGMIRSHHGPWDDEDRKGSLPNLPKLIKAADILAHALGLGHPQGFHKLQSNTEAFLHNVWTITHIQEKERESFLEEIKKVFEREYSLYTS